MLGDHHQYKEDQPGNEAGVVLNSVVPSHVAQGLG